MCGETRNPEASGAGRITCKANDTYLQEWYVKPDVCLSLGIFFLQVLSRGHMGASRHEYKNGFPTRLPYPGELHSDVPVLACLGKQNYDFIF